MIPPPLTGNAAVDRAFQDLVKKLNVLNLEAAVGAVRVLVGRGGGGGGGGTILRPRTAVAIDVYLYKHTDPSNPDDLIGSTTTDAFGLWEYDLATYCWDNNHEAPFMVTYKVAGVVTGHRTLPDHFWRNQAEDGYLPILVGHREVKT